jgi:hypothetical protein
VNQITNRDEIARDIDQAGAADNAFPLLLVMPRHLSVHPFANPALWVQNRI